jgi:thioredoxin 1
MGDFLIVNEGNFEVEVLKSAQPVLLEFGAVWCGPCKRLEPILKQLGEEWKGRVLLAKMDVDENAAVTMKYQIMSVPTLILFQQGKALQRVTGLQPKERLIEKFGSFLG